MLVQEIQLFKTDPYSPVAITDVYEYDGVPVINKKIALPVSKVSNSFDTSTPLPITLSNVVIGYLVFTNNRGLIPFNQMSEFEFIAYLTVGNHSVYSNITEFEFQSNFLIINEDFMIEYTMDHKESSPLWGGFVHELPTGSPVTRYKKNMGSIEIGNKLKILDPFSQESIIRGIEQPYAFERFLKLYHLLELKFDFKVIDEIKNLSLPADANQIGKVLKRYSDKEQDRLFEIIEDGCTNIVDLERVLANVSQFPQVAEDMFIHHGKSPGDLQLGNLHKFQAIVQSGSFTSQNFTALGIPHKDPHRRIILNITSYWIYRIRCSIAHNKVGEYILSWSNENFIVEFGEPLIREVLLQVFKATP